jgi:hypothetical protein
MSVRVAALLAWSLWALSVAFAVFGLLFLYLNGSFEHVLDESLGVDVAMAITFPTVGALVATRQPGNAVGWIFCAIGLSGGASIFFSEYGIYALVTRPGSGPGSGCRASPSPYRSCPSSFRTDGCSHPAGCRSRASQPP